MLDPLRLRQILQIQIQTAIAQSVVPAPATQGCETEKRASTSYFGDGSLHVRSSVSTNMQGDSTFCVSICILVSIELALALQFTFKKNDENTIFRDWPS